MYLRNSVSNYKNADIPSINRAIDIFDWDNSFEGKNVHEQVFFFNKTILNIFHNYIPDKTILCNDKDPPWFNNEIRNILTMKNNIFERYIANGKSQTDYEWLQLISNSLTEIIRSSKEKFHCKLSTNLTNHYVIKNLLVDTQNFRQWQKYSNNPASSC